MKRLATRRGTLIGMASLALFAPPALARSPDIYTGLLSGTAVGGYDPVAYFRDGKPAPGKRDITWNWRGATWRFATVDNRTAFQANPDAFAPQYGGYCAWAVAEGYTAQGDPKHWKIFGGKLYLNYDARVQATWQKDIPGNIARAQKNWPAVLAK